MKFSPDKRQSDTLEKRGLPKREAPLPEKVKPAVPR